MNWVDLVLIVLLILFATRAFFRGFIHESFDLLSVLIAFLISFLLYHPLSDILAKRLSVPVSFTNVIAFSAIFFVLLFIYHFFIIIFYDKIPDKWQNSKLNKYTAVIPGVLRGLLVLWIVLSLIVIIPFSNNTKNTITSSFIGGNLAKGSNVVEGFINNIFGNAVGDTLNFLTVRPESGESVDLGFKVSNAKLDPASEEKMLELINEARTSRGLKPLVMDEKLRDLARAHANDMFSRGYFAHNTPEGLTPFDRMDKAGIKYLTAGENLALAPDVDIAENGLMNSPGHRANILTPEFNKIGIGCLDGGIYGKMFAQEFTD